jgi:hypothetical protein
VAESVIPQQVPPTRYNIKTTVLYLYFTVLKKGKAIPGTGREGP